MKRIKFNLWILSSLLISVVLLFQVAFDWSAIAFSSFALICLSQWLRSKKVLGLYKTPLQLHSNANEFFNRLDNPLNVPQFDQLFQPTQETDR